MWFSFWRSRDRFTLDELRYLTEQLMIIEVVDDVNKDFVRKALRSIAELITYGDQHDSEFFEGEPSIKRAVERATAQLLIGSVE